MPQFLMSVNHSVDTYNTSREYLAYDSEEEMAQALADTGAFNQQLIDDGYFVFAGGLKPPETATTVDGQGDEPVLTDGPYATLDVYLGGFWVIDVPDEETALKLAADGSRACRAKVEVRPFDSL